MIPTRILRLEKLISWVVVCPVSGGSFCRKLETNGSDDYDDSSLPQSGLRI